MYSYFILRWVQRALVASITDFSIDDVNDDDNYHNDNHVDIHDNHNDDHWSYSYAMIILVIRTFHHHRRVFFGAMESWAGFWLVNIIWAGFWWVEDQMYKYNEQGSNVQKWVEDKILILQ